MIFNEHSNLRGCHAFLGASKFHWLNYDEDLLIQRYKNQYSTSIGTILHSLASDCISNNIKLSKTSDKHMIALELIRNGIPYDYIDAGQILETLAPFVNDAIGFRMRSEQILFYSENCFGTADAICYRDKTLRIHDYKSGSMPAHIEQLLIYAALFCLEYKINPIDIKLIELRIYQNGEILYYNPEPREIIEISDKIISNDKIIEKINAKGAIV